MTEWQWKVIIALIRVVLGLVHLSGESFKDTNILKEALDREE